MVMKIEHFGKQISNTWEVFNVVLENNGEDQKDRSCEKEEILDKEERNILHKINWRKANWNGHILRWNCLLKHIVEGNIEGRIEVTGNEKEDVSSYRIALRKTGDTGN